MSQTQAEAAFEAATGPTRRLNLRAADLRAANVPQNASFFDCDFSGADMSGLDLAGLHFEACTFQQTNFEGAILVGCEFTEACNFFGANLTSVDATGAKFNRAELKEVKAEKGDFVDADFTAAQLHRANFDRADLTNATGFAPDQTSVYGAVFSGPDVDDWTKLRYEFTGLKLFLNLLPALIFMISMLANAYANVAFDFFRSSATGAALCGAGGKACTEYAVWQVLLGVREGVLAVVFSIFAIVYNAARFFVTLRVSYLARAEDRSHVTPPCAGREGYAFLVKAALFVRIGKWLMLALFAINMVDLLGERVSLPKREG